MNVERDGDSFVAEEGGAVVGRARLTPEGGVVLDLDDPREGVALALIRAIAAAQGGGPEAGDDEGSLGSLHLQTDNQAAVIQLVTRLVPRVFPSPATVVSPARNGWIAVYDEVAERDPHQLVRLGRELSQASGLVVFAMGVEAGRLAHYTAFESGRILDEYLSVPEFRGPIASGDAVALRANPTVVARLTGASAAAVRAVARTAASPDELPPAEELLRELAEAFGLEGTRVRFEDAHYVPGSVVVEHE